jgi:hypothetical protein
MYTFSDIGAPKKTRHRFYHNDGIMYNIITYDKSARSYNDSLDVRKYRSVITSFPDNYLLSVSPPTSIQPELFQEMHPNPSLQITEIIEGTLIHLFYDYRTSEWEIATKNAIGGNYKLFNRKNAAPLKKDHPTVRDMFFDCLRLPRSYKMSVLSDELSIDYSYCFVMRHPNNHITMDIEKPELFLVAVYDIYPNRVNHVPQVVFEKWTCFKDMPVIRFPQLFQDSSGLSSDDYKSLAIKNGLMGITFLDLESGDRYNIENPIYLNQKQLSKTDILYQYLCLRRINQTAVFLKHFPKYSDEFHGFHECYKAFIEKAHGAYISVFINKNSDTKASEIITHIIHQIHKQYLCGGRKAPITKKRVYELLETLFTPDELLYFITEDRRLYFYSEVS